MKTAPATSFDAFHRRSLTERDAFWSEQAELIDWQQPFTQVCDYSNPPFARWFIGGKTNLCHNAVDRHLATRAAQNALIWVSTETDQERVYTFAELHLEVQRMAAVLLSLGVGQGDRVLIYMPMIAEAAFAMLACARIGAIHSVVFGGFASGSLADRIDNATPCVVISADAGSRAGKVVAYKPLLDEAIRLAQHRPKKVLLVDRGLSAMQRTPGRDVDYAPLREKHLNAVVPCVWLDAEHVSYTLYTSGTTGKPKGVQRDTGGYAVALAASIKHIFCGLPGETYFSTSDIGWVVGHSYIVYGPLIAGMATIMYEGLPIRPDAGIWWSLVEKYRVSVMFSAPTAVRVLKKQDPKYLREYDLSSLKSLFLAGEPLDEPTAKWIADALQKPIIDNYWQTETGWPILALANGVEKAQSKFGSPGKPMYGYDVQDRRREHRRRVDGSESERRRRHRGAAAAGLHADRVARRRALRQDLLEQHPGPDALQHLRLGNSRRRRLLLHPRPHRRRDQRRRAPPRNARNRREHFQPSGDRRSRRRRRRRSAQGPGRDGVCGLERRIARRRPGGGAEARRRNHEGR